MAPATVTLCESLRPWRNAGLEFVFDEHGLFAAAQAEAAQESVPQQGHAQQYAQPQFHPQAQPQAQQQPQHQAQRSHAQPSHATAYAERQRAARTAPAASGAKGAGGQQTAAPQRPSAAAGLAVHPTPQPPEEWPARWQAIWAKVRQPSPVVWTYWSLGDDLSGRANAERGALLRQIIGSLQLPAGSSSFWPVALPEEAQDAGSELIAAPEIFLAGLRRVRPRYCITFGSKALKTFAPDARLMPYTFTQFLGHRLIALPDIDNLLTSQGTVPAVIAFLRTAVTLRG